uniref:Ariadne RBR E3 ubiquitin protein ligase 2 n=1 Tax=Oryctolagus cuniculus TaxID=9986 RepID=A0A5F9C8R3_RABIT
MSVDMNSQGSDSNEEDYDPNCEEEEEEEDEDPGDIEDYYVGVASDVEQQGADAFDPEEYQFTCLTYKESEGALKEHMTSLASVLKVSHSVAKLILVNFHCIYRTLPSSWPSVSTLCNTPIPMRTTWSLDPGRSCLNTSRLSWRLRSKICHGKWSVLTAMTEGTWRTRCI